MCSTISYNTMSSETGCEALHLRGRVIENVVPLSGSLLTETVPP